MPWSDAALERAISEAVGCVVRAARARRRAGRVRGVGVDVEPLRMVHPDAARFFLTRAERAWIRRQEPARHSHHLLRLWTIKEALFKADPENHTTMLGDYALRDPGASRGRAILTQRGRHLALHYIVIRLSAGWLSVATAHAEEA